MGHIMGQLFKRVFSEGFRAFFLGAAIWAILSGLVWEVWLAKGQSGALLSDLPMAPQYWHAHEMVFGYGAAAVGGFFLTAVAAGRGVVVGAIVALWVLGRVAVWNAAVLPPVLVAALDLSFLFALMWRIGLHLKKRPKPQHMVFLAFLTTIFGGNLLVHLDWLGHWNGYWDGASYDGVRMGLLALCGLIIVLGGRVTPGFIRNAMHRLGADEGSLPPTTPRLDRVIVPLSVALPWSVLVSNLSPILALMLALMHGARVAQWRPRFSLRDPMLWSLFAAQILVIGGLVIWALAGWGVGNETGALHLLGVGGIGGMTLAVMTRAALGHTGRAPVAPAPVVAGYVLMIIAAVSRWAASGFLVNWYGPLVLVAGAAWVAAFVLFLAGMMPALTLPRTPRPVPSPPPEEKMRNLRMKTAAT